ncbi:MAG: hypothetical protein BJ554DRAFT_5238, partial [Olpidium bornovanus]
GGGASGQFGDGFLHFLRELPDEVPRASVAASPARLAPEEGHQPRIAALLRCGLDVAGVQGYGTVAEAPGQRVEGASHVVRKAAGQPTGVVPAEDGGPAEIGPQHGLLVRLRSQALVRREERCSQRRAGRAQGHHAKDSPAVDDPSRRHDRDRDGFADGACQSQRPNCADVTCATGGKRQNRQHRSAWRKTRSAQSEATVNRPSCGPSRDALQLDFRKFCQGSG